MILSFFHNWRLFKNISFSLKYWIDVDRLFKYCISNSFSPIIKEKQIFKVKFLWIFGDWKSNIFCWSIEFFISNFSLFYNEKIFCFSISDPNLLNSISDNIIFFLKTSKIYYFSSFFKKILFILFDIDNLFN